MPPPFREKSWPGWLRFLVQSGLQALIDLIYPPRCAACGIRFSGEAGGSSRSPGSSQSGTEPRKGNGNWMETGIPAGVGTESGTDSPDADFCRNCASAMERIHPPFCSLCGEPFAGQFPDPFACVNCAGQPFAFDFAISAWQSTGPLREAIHRFKYSHRIHLRLALARKLHDALADPRLVETLAPGAGENWCLVPVPLHSKRLRERGFNQSAELARQLAHLTGLPLHNVLRRTRYTTAQARLDRQQRLANLAGAFAITRKEAARLAGKNILLIDDVFTTGSTTHECASVLKKSAHAARVIVLTVAR